MSETFYFIGFHLSIEINRRIAERGYLRSTEIDGDFGDFGKIMLGAVLAFQLENGLETDGVCGAMTRAALM